MPNYKMSRKSSNMEDISVVKEKPRKRSLVERELETTLAPQFTSPLANGVGTNTSRYGRARRSKGDSDFCDTDKAVTNILRSQNQERSPVTSPAYKMHASNSTVNAESPRKVVDSQIENIYNTNISLSRFGSDELQQAKSPAKKFSKVYIRKDLIQSKERKQEKEETVTLIKSIFSPQPNSGQKQNHLLNILERSSEKYDLPNNTSLSKPQNGFLNNSSVVKTLDFDCGKSKDSKMRRKKLQEAKVLSKNELFELEAQCLFQVGDIVWARMGTFPFWPCIVTREPGSEMFVKKKLFGKIERDMIHVTFFGDNGRRSWLLDSLLRPYHGLVEFETARDQFTPEAKKKDPKLYAAYFISQKKLPLWHNSIDEADYVQREPKRLRIDLLNELLCGPKPIITPVKNQNSKKISRTESLNEILCDTLFSENDDAKSEGFKTRNKSLDVSEVVTACLDDMAAKSGMTQIQKQSHMDRWLQKAKSKTPEKSQLNISVTIERLDKEKGNKDKPKERDSMKKKKKSWEKEVLVKNPYSLRRNTESRTLRSYNNEHDYSKSFESETEMDLDKTDQGDGQETDNGSICVIENVVSLSQEGNDCEKVTKDPKNVELSIDKDKEIVNLQDDIEINLTKEKTSKFAFSTDTTIVENSSEKGNKLDSIVDEPIIDELVMNAAVPEKKNTKNIAIECDVPIESDSEMLAVDKVDSNVLKLSPDSKDLDCVNENEQESVNQENQIENDKKLEDVIMVEATDLLKSLDSLIDEDATSCSSITPVLELQRNNVEDMDVSKNLDEPEDRDSVVDNVNNDSNIKSAPTKVMTTTVTEKKDLDNEATVENANTVKEDAVAISDARDSTPAIQDKESFNDIEANSVTSITDSVDRQILQDDTAIITTESISSLDNKEKVTVPEISSESCEDSKKQAYTVSEVSSIKNAETIPDLMTYNDVSTQNELGNGSLTDDTKSVISTTKVDDDVGSDDPVIPLENDVSVALDEDKSELPREVELDENVDADKEIIKLDNDKDSIKRVVDSADVTINDDDCDSTVNDLPTEDKIATSETNFDDNFSLYSESITGFTDDTNMDKDFDPDAISLDSLSSCNTNIVLPRITRVTSLSDRNKRDSSIAKRMLLESDDESVSSLEDVALSEFRRRKNKPRSKSNLVLNIDTVESDKKLRLVLTDCVLENKESNLPQVTDVKTDGETEIANSPSIERRVQKRSLRLRRSQSPSKANDIKCNGLPLSIDSSPFTSKDPSPERKKEVELDTISIKSSESSSSTKRKIKKVEPDPMQEPQFLQYLELRLDDLIDEHPELTHPEIVAYLYKTWQYEENIKSDIKKSDELEQSKLVKGLGAVNEKSPKKKRVVKKKVIDINKIMSKEMKSPEFKKRAIKKDPEFKTSPDAKKSLDNLAPKELPKRKVSKAFYKEDYSDIEEEIEMFEIFKAKKTIKVEKGNETKASSSDVTVKAEPDTSTVKSEVKKDADDVKDATDEVIELNDDLEYVDEEEMYFEQLTTHKPNIFKGINREKVCEICEFSSNLVKCKTCNGMFHVDCVNKVEEVVEIAAPTRGRKKKKKPVGRRGRKPKSSLDSNDESHSDEKSHNASEENISTDDIEPIVISDVEDFESKLEVKIKEAMESIIPIDCDSDASNDRLDWTDAEAGNCKIVDVTLKPRIKTEVIDYSDFKCKNCQQNDTPICFVCKLTISPKNKVEQRQKCQVAHCHKYYHLECLEHWPQTQLTTGEPSRNNKKIDEHFESLMCPRHVCHTCVCDDPRGCKTRFSGDKLARCVRCPATYHSFTKCLPAGSQILSASHIVCPRHYEHRPGKIPYHVNTGWCFICALGGNLICCDYCPTSFHADCLNIEPPEGGYMCEDCETGRLPLYGEMVWVKLGHYRWWPGIVLHPSEIPDNIMAVKHSPGEFVVRFFGQYDHYWVNRGRVFPYQEGDTGKISGQKSKIDEAFSIAMEHAQRAFEILKNVEPNDEESQDIQSSLLPPRYVKLKVNKPCGALYGRRPDVEESSLTQCDCNPDEEDPCGPYTHCLNRMLLTECGPICRAGERCNNRAFEKRQYPKMVPYRTPSRGWGLKTLEGIKAGQFVIEYVGELIDESEFRRRMARKHETRDENFYFLTLDKERLIDAGPKGNLARFMNHCCEPNCETQKWTVLGDVRVGLFAIHDIPANTEVTFNYNLECTGIEKKQCMCGAKRCAGYIGAKPKQDEPQPKKQKIPAKRTYTKRKKTESPSTKTPNKPKRPVGRPCKPRELTEIEKDLLIIKNATNGISSDSEGSGRLSSVENDVKALKRKRVSFSTEENLLNGSLSNTDSSSVKRMKMTELSEVGD